MNQSADHGRRVRILLTEGSSLSARQTLYALAAFRPIIDVCDPRPWLCLARYSRFVRRLHRCPPFATDPAEYLQFLISRLRIGRYDVLLPVHDQVFLLARYRDQLRRLTGLAVPEFATLQRLQSKAGFLRVLQELRLPHPPTEVVTTRKELEQTAHGPCYIKLAHSTAGRGVWQVNTPTDVKRVGDILEREGVLDGRAEVLVQQPAMGTLCVVQSVFQHGRLVAAHNYAARALGVGGSAWARVSVDHPRVVEDLERLGAHLNWHGALMLDYLYDPATERPAYIDANPRIGETVNATLSGVNLCEALVRVSLDQPVDRLPPGRVGVRTHSVMMRLLAAAEQGERRWSSVREMARAVRGEDIYADSEDELTRPRDDPLSLLPAAVVGLGLILHPRSVERIIGGTVANYALTETTARAIRQMPDTYGKLPP